MRFFSHKMSGYEKWTFGFWILMDFVHFDLLGKHCFLTFPASVFDTKSLNLSFCFDPYVPKKHFNNSVNLPVYADFTWPSNSNLKVGSSRTVTHSKVAQQQGQLSANQPRVRCRLSIWPSRPVTPVHQHHGDVPLAEELFAHYLIKMSAQSCAQGIISTYLSELSAVKL